MSTTTRWTSADLESLPDDGTRYEIIDGELYWIVSWKDRTVDVYRRGDAEQSLAGRLGEGDALMSALLPGFSCPVSDLFARIPSAIHEEGLD